MENKPIVTCCGDQALIAKLHPYIKQGLSREKVEWRRSYGRPPRTISVDANFVPYKQDLVTGDDVWQLLGKAFFHVFWTESDIDAYKSSVREEISEWLSVLKSNNVSDWLIVVAVNEESKVKTKILRTSVMDKVKSDFCSKQPDRCAVLHEPLRPDSKSSESWTKLFMLMRQHILQAFNVNLTRFEEHMRQQREKRQEPGWTFNSYFLLQEELAFMFEMLGLYEDSLVQYDELDALFTQFVLNHAAGDSADWLQVFVNNPPTRWDSVQLSKPINLEKRQLIQKCDASLLDFRNYLYLRQCTMLNLLSKHKEIAQRALPFMQNCLKELELLNLRLPAGGAACWVFLTCLEIVRTCESYGSKGDMEAYSLHMAVLWDYAKKKLYTLGGFCGLLPGTKTLSDHLSLVVELISGFTMPEDNEALTKLREALSSQTMFTKHYLELCELAMGTYKHIGRVRSAALISRDLADFYMAVGEYHKAEAFLQGALKVYVQESWSVLSDDVRLHLAQCHKLMAARDKYIRTCIHLASSSTLNPDKRRFYHQEMLSISEKVKDNPVFLPTKPLFMIPQVQSGNQSFLVTETSLVTLDLHLSSLEPIKCDNITASLSFKAEEHIILHIPDHVEESGSKKHKRNPSGGSFASIGSISSGNSVDVVNAIPGATKYPQSISLNEHFEYAANKKTITTSGLRSKMNLRRVDSAPRVIIDKDIDKGDHSMCVESGEVTLVPGSNKVCLKAQLSEPGMYTVTQLCLRVGGAEFLRNIPVEQVSFMVLCEQPQLSLTNKQDVLYAGISQSIHVSVSAGSHDIDGTTRLKLTHPVDLRVTGKTWQNRICELPGLRAKETYECGLVVIAQLRPDTSSPWTHQLKVEWVGPDVLVSRHLSFQQPIKISHTLHTSGARKFVQCVVQSCAEPSFSLVNPELTTNDVDTSLVSLNKQHKPLVISGDQTVSYMWELKPNVPECEPRLECHFQVKYRESCEDEEGSNTTDSGEMVDRCHYHFTLDNYRTLYVVTSSVVLPSGETEYCIKNAYKFTFTISSLQSDSGELVYNVSSEKDTWSLDDGQTQGVVQFSEGSFTHSIPVRAQTEGYLGHPHVHLYTPITGWSKAIESNTTQQVSLDVGDLESQGILTGLEIGRVYYLNLASRVQVLPPQRRSRGDAVVVSETGDSKTSHHTSTTTSTSTNVTVARLEVVDSGPL